MTREPLTTKSCTTTEPLDFTLTLSEYQCGGAYVLNRQTGSDRLTSMLKARLMISRKSVVCISTH